MNKQQAEDLERTIELKLKVWAHVANKLINKSVNPYEIPLDNIENNRGRQKKALRLLDDVVSFCRSEKTQYSSSKMR